MGLLVPTRRRDRDGARKDARKRMRMNHALPALAVLAAFTLAPLHGASAASSPLTLSALRDIVGVGSPKLSPDGKSVVVGVTHADFKANKNITQLELIDVTSGARRA